MEHVTDGAGWRADSACACALVPDRELIESGLVSLVLCDRCTRETAPLELVGEQLLCGDCLPVVVLKPRPKLPFRSRKPRQIKYYNAHIDELRVKDRNRKRLAHGIALDAPLIKRGRPRKIVGDNPPDKGVYSGP